VLVALVCWAGGCGRNREAAVGDLASLSIPRYRVNFDGKHRTARIVGELRNTGTQPVRKCVVVAVLRGASGEERGSGRTVVEDIRPGQPKAFSIQMESQGKERDVEFQILPPSADQEKTPQQETQNAP
jgi:hypothetical protein